MIYIQKDKFYNKICSYYEGLNKLEDYNELTSQDENELSQFIEQKKLKKEFLKEKEDIIEYLKNTSYLVIESYESGKPLSSSFVEIRKQKIARLNELEKLL